MIDTALEFLQTELDIYLHSKLNISGKAVTLLNISQLQEASGNDSAQERNAYITLVNVEEDRISKSQENFIRKDTGIVYQNPEIFINLYVLFSVNLSKYDESLKRLSYIIQFFQKQTVFDQLSSPSLDPSILKLVVDMHSMTFEQLNHLWGILGGKYLPSVLYKIRKININDDAVISEAGFIKEIQLTNGLKKVVS